MEPIKSLAVGCSMVVASPERFKCASVFTALLGALQQIPRNHWDVQVARIVKGPKEFASAVRRARDLEELQVGHWHFGFFVDRDKIEVPRVVMYHELLAQHPDPLNPEYPSVAIQFKKDIKSLNMFIRSPKIKTLSTVETGNWKFVSYLSSMSKAYCVVMTGDDVLLTGQAQRSEIQDSGVPDPRMQKLESVAGNLEQFRSLVTSAFKDLA